MNASGQQRSNANNTTSKRKLDDTDNKSEVKKVGFIDINLIVLPLQVSF